MPNKSVSPLGWLKTGAVLCFSFIQPTMNASTRQEVIFPLPDLNALLLPIYVAAPRPRRQQQQQTNKPKICLMKHTLCACNINRAKVEKWHMLDRAL